jgi:hypothetical protein
MLPTIQFEKILQLFAGTLKAAHGKSGGEATHTREHKPGRDRVDEETEVVIVDQS